MRTTKQKIISAVVLVISMLTAQTAFAYYNPSTGRWLSRDPIGEPGFQTLQMAQGTSQVGPVPAARQSSRWVSRDPISEPAFKVFSDKYRGAFDWDAEKFIYGFVNNNPISATDALGLKTCDEICNDARKNPSVSNSQGEMGGIVCFDGKKCPCVFEYPSSYGFKRGDCPEIDQIVKKHEEEHIRRGTECDTKGCSPTRGRYPAGRDARKEECDLKKQDIAELDKLSKSLNGKCAGDAALLKAMLDLWVQDKCK